MRVEQASGDGNLLTDQVSESPERQTLSGGASTVRMAVGEPPRQ
jgi:hypothetical protein